MPSGTLYTAGRVIVSRLYFSATRVLANYTMGTYKIVLPSRELGDGRVFCGNLTSGE